MTKKIQTQYQRFNLRGANKLVLKRKEKMYSEEILTVFYRIKQILTLYSNPYLINILMSDELRMFRLSLIFIYK